MEHPHGAPKIAPKNCMSGTPYKPRKPVLYEDFTHTTAQSVSLPNIITLGRILLVAVIVWAIASSQMEIAFAIFIVAGVSDAVDGFLAQRFNLANAPGGLLG